MNGTLLLIDFPNGGPRGLATDRETLTTGRKNVIVIVIVFQYWNSVPEWRWPVDTLALGRHPDSLTLSHARRGDLTTVRLRLGQNPGDGGQSSENTMQIVHKSPRYRQSKFRG